jgi:hypothetical protein
MFTIVQTVIAIVVVYLVFSIIVYVIVEWIAGLLHLRGNMLKDAVINMFENTAYKELGEQIFNHPQIESLRTRRDKLPSYIPAKNIAIALIDLIKDRANNPGEVKMAAVKNSTSSEDEVYTMYKAGLSQLDNAAGPANLKEGATRSQKSFLTSLTEQTSDLSSLTDAIERWYNSYMDRVTGWYKRNIKIVVLAVGVVVTVGFNVDTIHIVRAASTDPALRARLNALGDELLKDSVVNRVVQEQGDQSYFDDYVNDESFAGKTTEEKNLVRDSLAAAILGKDQSELLHMTSIVNEWNLPVGWGIKKDHSLLWTIIGWVITALALSAGAPFWFDMLKRLVNIRNAGVKPDPVKKND